MQIVVCGELIAGIKFMIFVDPDIYVSYAEKVTDDY
jgi:hypothetical protein